jgi:hypothetical protein
MIRRLTRLHTNLAEESQYDWELCIENLQIGSNSTAADVDWAIGHGTPQHCRCHHVAPAGLSTNEKYLGE